jgi:hypothetical protein
LLEGQVPAWFSAAGAPELAEGPFEERADLGDLAEGAIAGLSVPAGRGRFGFGFSFHINKVEYLLIKGKQKRCPKKKMEGENDRRPTFQDVSANPAKSAARSIRTFS